MDFSFLSFPIYFLKLKGKSCGTFECLRQISSVINSVHVFLSKGIGTTHELDKQKFHTHFFYHNRKNKLEKIHKKT